MVSLYERYSNYNKCYQHGSILATTLQKTSSIPFKSLENKKMTVGIVYDIVYGYVNTV